MLPSDVSLEAGEAPVIVTRRHFINYLPILLAAVIVLAVLSFASGWVLANPAIIGASVVPIATLALTLLGVLVSITALVAFAVYRRSLLILTNIHLFVVVQAGLFGRTVSKLTLDEIQDAEGVRRGLFATIFNYGTIEIETAGADENFRFTYAPNPIGLATQIADEHEKFEREHTFEHP